MEKTVEKKESKGFFWKFIHGIEVVGNKLPHPFYLFSILIVVSLVLSVIFSGATTSYEKASSSGGEPEIVEVTIKNLINKETITNVTQNMYSIYYNFSPMMMMGLLLLSIGLSETVGLFGAFIKRFIGGAKPAMVFAVVAFIAINANTASNAGILGATAVSASVFAALGYNPWLGILLAYAAGNAGMSANVFVGNLDVLLSGINVSVCEALGLDTSTVHVLQHWYFLLVCAIVLTFVYTFVTIKFVRPYLGEAKDLSLVRAADDNSELTPVERKGLRNAGIAALIYLVVLVLITRPKNSFFRADDGSIVPNSPLIKSVLTLLFLFFLVTGATYGRTVGKIEKWNQLPALLATGINSMTTFMVIALPASLFIHLFNASNIPTYLGSVGGSWLKSTGIQGFGLFLLVALFSTFLNLFMTSGSSKWMILAPILIPMLYTLGYSPALATIIYRIGDSATNAVAPISSDVALIVGLLAKYNTDKSKEPGMGTVFAGCMPYAIATFAAELIILAIWWALKLPLGPGVSMLVG